MEENNFENNENENIENKKVCENDDEDLNVNNEVNDSTVNEKNDELEIFINEKDLPKDDDNIDKNKNEYNIYIVKE